MEFTFPITIKDLESIYENAFQDKKYANTLHLTGNFMHFFEKPVEIKENFKVRIQPKNKVFNIKKLRTDTMFLRINGFCKDCNQIKTTYTFTIEDNPFLKQVKPDYVDVLVRRSNEHKHQNSNDETSHSESSQSDSEQVKLPKPIPQITGEERINVAEDIILHHNGSVKSYVLKQKTLSLPVASEDVYRRIVCEYKDTDKISVDWYTNMLAAATYLKH